MLSLNLIKQTSLGTFELNNQRKHFVVKNSPFQLIFSYEDPTFYKLLTSCDFDCSLLYDSEEGDFKEVDFVKEKPVVAKTNLQGDNKIVVEAKIKVLTSQLEDMLFRVLVKVVEKQGEVIASAHSEPIKVISKSDQVKKNFSNSSNNHTQPITRVSSPSLSTPESSMSTLSAAEIQKAKRAQQKHQQNLTHNLTISELAAIQEGLAENHAQIIRISEYTRRLINELNSLRAEKSGTFSSSSNRLITPPPPSHFQSLSREMEVLAKPMLTPPKSRKRGL